MTSKPPRREQAQRQRGGAVVSLSLKRKPPHPDRTRGLRKDPAMTYSRGVSHYHRRRKLNYCVRNGNRCGLSALVTGRVWIVC